MMSLVDRDSSDYNNIDNKLRVGYYQDKTLDTQKGKFLYSRFRSWRRSEIENYLFNKTVLARVTGKTDEDISNFFAKRYSIIIPSPNDYIASDVKDNTRPFFDLSGKEYIQSFCNAYNLTKYDIVRAFEKDDVCDDIVTLLLEIQQMCS